MRARSYTTKIEFWKSTQVNDGFGGTVNEDALVTSKWAQKRTQGAGYKFQQFGLNEFKNPVIFRIRKGSITVTEDMFIKFKSNTFIIKGVENLNLDNRFINIYCDEA